MKLLTLTEGTFKIIISLYGKYSNPITWKYSWHAQDYLINVSLFVSRGELTRITLVIVSE